MSVDTTIYYTPIDLIELLDIDSATSEATGYPKEHLLDGKLKTAWKPTTTGDQEIVIDLQAALPSAVYAFGYFIRNYTTDHSNSNTAKFKVYHSTDGVTWGSAIIDQVISSAATPCRIHEVAAAGVLNRYLKITFTTLNTTLEISHLFLCEKQSISRGPQRPGSIDNAFLNVHQGDDAEDSPVVAKNYLPVKKITRKYTVLSSTEYAALYAVFNRAGGGRHLIVVVDYLSGSGGTPYVAKIKDMLTETDTDHDLYDMTITLQTQAYRHPSLGY